MNVDLYVDPITHDLVIDPVTGIRMTADLTEDATQRIKVRLLIFLGEWVLDSREGTPYFQQILTKTSRAAVDAIFRAKIKEDPFVLEVLSLESTFDSASRFYSLSFSVSLVNGETVNDTITLEI